MQTSFLQHPFELALKQQCGLADLPRPWTECRVQRQLAKGEGESEANLDAAHCSSLLDGHDPGLITDCTIIVWT